MTPVDQRVIATTEAGAGDCLSACIATVLDLSLDDVPVFVAETDWYHAIVTWLEARGLALVFLQNLQRSWNWIPPRDVPIVVGGPSPRGPWGHAVVAMWTDDAPGMKVVHDPHPSRAGLAGEIDRAYVLVPRP